MIGAAAVEGNMLTPIALIQATVYGMMDRGFGRIVNITSASIKHPIAALELSTARASVSRAPSPCSRARPPGTTSRSTASCPGRSIPTDCAAPARRWPKQAKVALSRHRYRAQSGRSRRTLWHGG